MDFSTFINALSTLTFKNSHGTKENVIQQFMALPIKRKQICKENDVSQL